jgi:hypothetical protein
MSKPTYAVTGSERVTSLAKRRHTPRGPFPLRPKGLIRKPHKYAGNPVYAYRRIVRCGQILFTGAFLWVSAAFVAMVYAWRKL